MSVPQLKFPVADAHTPCMAIYALLERARSEGNHDPYDDDIVQIANALMSIEKSFGIFFVYLDEKLEQKDYFGALQVGAALVQHEATLLEAAIGIRSGSRRN